MKCAECQTEMLASTEPHQFTLDGIDYDETFNVDRCPNHPEQWLLEGLNLEDTENRLAVRLVQEQRRGPQAVRWMLRGIYIEEILMRFPAVSREEVRGWRHGRGTDIHEDLIQWAYKVGPTGYVTDECLCGGCMLPSSRLPPSGG